MVLKLSKSTVTHVLKYQTLNFKADNAFLSKSPLLAILEGECHHLLLSNHFTSLCGQEGDLERQSRWSRRGSFGA